MNKLGIIGCGQWGSNHVRNFSHLLGSDNIVCADSDKKRLESMKKTFLNISVTTNYKDILKNPKINAVCVSTPTSTHYKIVKESLESGKDVLCEKPLCTKVNEAKELMAIARKKKCILMVGYVFLFNSGIRKLEEYIKFNECGRIYYIHTERTNLGPIRNDVNAVWDLASHDVSIFNYLLNSMPVMVTAKGARYLQKNYEDVAFISLVYPKDILVNIHISWLDPRKIRQITVIGDKKMIVWDDLDNIGPIKIYDKKVVRTQYYETFGDFFLLTKEGDITIPKVELHEPLRDEDIYFLECIKKRQEPVCGGQSGLDVVKVLCAVDKSMQGQGSPVKII